MSTRRGISPPAICGSSHAASFSLPARSEAWISLRGQFLRELFHPREDQRVPSIKEDGADLACAHSLILKGIIPAVACRPGRETLHFGSVAKRSSSTHRAARGRWRRPAIAVLCTAALGILGPRGFAQASSITTSQSGASTTASKPAAPAPTVAQEEAEALREAVGSAAGNPQTLITNLEQFLTRFPGSPQREAVLRTIFKEALQANDPRTAVAY